MKHPKCPIDWQMNKHNVMYSNSETLLGNKKEWILFGNKKQCDIIDQCYNSNLPGKNYVQGSIYFKRIKLKYMNYLR